MRADYLAALPNQNYRGAFASTDTQSGALGVIALYTHNPKTWFHELAHAAHHTIAPDNPGTTEQRETVAVYAIVS